MDGWMRDEEELDSTSPSGSHWPSILTLTIDIRSTEEDIVMETQEVEVAAEATKGQMSVEEALQEVLRRALVHDGLARGLKQAVKALDR